MLQKYFFSVENYSGGGGALSEIEPKWGGGAYAKGGAYAGEYGYVHKLYHCCSVHNAMIYGFYCLER